MVGRARFCDGCPPVRASRRARWAFTHWRRGNHISGRGAGCCRRDGPVARLRHGIGTGRIENGRWQRRGGRHILRSCLFDQDAGAKTTAHPLNKSCARVIRSNLLVGIAVSFAGDVLLPLIDHIAAKLSFAKPRRRDVGATPLTGSALTSALSALGQAAAELAREVCRYSQAVSFDLTRK